MDTSENFELFKKYYQDWFTKVGLYYENINFDKAEIVLSADKTPAGQWFYLEGKRLFGHLEQVQFLESKFIKLHNLVEYLWDAKQAGDLNLTKLYFEDFLILSGRMIPNLELSKQYILNYASKENVINLQI